MDGFTGLEVPGFVYWIKNQKGTNDMGKRHRVSFISKRCFNHEKRLVGLKRMRMNGIIKNLTGEVAVKSTMFHMLMIYQNSSSLTYENTQVLE